MTQGAGLGRILLFLMGACALAISRKFQAPQAFSGSVKDNNSCQGACSMSRLKLMGLNRLNCREAMILGFDVGILRFFLAV